MDLERSISQVRSLEQRTRRARCEPGGAGLRPTIHPTISAILGRDTPNAMDEAKTE